MTILYAIIKINLNLIHISQVNTNTMQSQLNFSISQIKTNLYLSIEQNSDQENVLIAQPEQLLELISHLKNDLFFKVLADICGIDYVVHAQYGKRFALVYNLLNIRHNQRIFVKIFCDDPLLHPNQPGIESVHSLFSSAIWLEREVYDMFGIKFENMLDPRRLLTDYDFKHFPLRKDFPLSGYEEVYYDHQNEKVAYKPLELDQEMRNFDFISPWQGILQDANSSATSTQLAQDTAVQDKK